MATVCGFCAMLYVMSSPLWCPHTWLFTEVTSKVLGQLGDACPVHIAAYAVIFINICIYILFFMFLPRYSCYGYTYAS